MTNAVADKAKVSALGDLMATSSGYHRLGDIQIIPKKRGIATMQGRGSNGADSSHRRGHPMRVASAGYQAFA